MRDVLNRARLLSQWVTGSIDVHSQLSISLKETQEDSQELGYGVSGVEYL